MCMCQKVCAAYVESVPSFSFSFFFFPSMAPPLSAPKCPDPVTVPLWVFFFFFSLSSAVHQFSLRSFLPPLPPLFSLFIPNSLPRFFFFPPVFSPRFTSHSSPKFLGSALFQSHILKNKLITPPTHGISQRKQKANKENNFFSRFFFPSFSPHFLAPKVNSGGITAALCECAYCEQSE